MDVVDKLFLLRILAMSTNSTRTTQKYILARMFLRVTRSILASCKARLGTIIIILSLTMLLRKQEFHI